MPFIVALICPQDRLPVLNALNKVDTRVVSLNAVADSSVRTLQSRNLIRDLEAWSLTFAPARRSCETVSSRSDEQPTSRLRLELAVKASAVDQAIGAIRSATRTGHSACRQPCEISVLPLEEWFGDSDGETAEFN
jgi:hypothetical protein